MPTTTTNICQAKASYKKVQGTLELNSTQLQWTANGQRTPSVRVPHDQATSLFCSKEGSAQVKLRLGVVGDDAGHTFMFTSPQSTAIIEREAFKRELTNIISNNRNAIQPINASPKSAIHVSDAHPKRVASMPMSRATSVSSSERASATPSRAIDDFRLRKKVLVKTPELAALHRELVLSGQITETEFWEGREHLLHAEAALEEQKRGKPGQLVDPRPQTVAGGDIKIVITPQLVHDIFEEYPVVAKAYSETVPSQLSEADFWKRYFQSKLFNNHRASIRSSAAQHVVKDDPIFDKYVEKEDNDLEPRRQFDSDVQLYIDLAATQEDHVDTGNQKDVTMQAGKQRGVLPLIRRFNEHSERLLNSAMGPPPKRKRTEGEFGDSAEDYYSQIDYDDLHGPDSSAAVILEMQDRDRYFQARSTVKNGMQEELKPELNLVINGLKSQLNDWSKNLNELAVEKKANDAALSTMTQNVQAHFSSKNLKNDIPEHLFRQMATCQTAANEFLRQFWSSVYPSLSEGQLSVSTPAQRTAKANKMASYLSRTPEKVNAIVSSAQQEGVDIAKIEVAMKPVLQAVNVALQFHNSRK